MILIQAKRFNNTTIQKLSSHIIKIQVCVNNSRLFFFSAKYYRSISYKKNTLLSKKKIIISTHTQSLTEAQVRSIGFVGRGKRFWAY